MRSAIIFIIGVAIALSAAATSPIKQDSINATQSVGLVLSGGGAKGIAHIGVIQALEDNDIPIDYITGTSMGAIVGSLYACGYTPAEMMDLIKSRSFSHWSTGKIDTRLTYYFLQDEPLPTMLNLNLGDTDSTLFKSVLPSSLINPLPMNFAFLELYAPYTAQCGGNFNNLFVPFRSVCSDMTNKRMVVSSHGSLSDAVRASMSFPLVFHPIERNGALLYDGGIYDNFPVDVMRDNFAPQIMIGVDVASTDSTDDNPNMMSQLETMIIQHSDTSLPAEWGIKLRLHLEEFGLLDFAKADRIYRIGYEKGLAMIDSIKSRIDARTPKEARALRRSVFKSHTPYLRFDSVSVTGGTTAQNAYVGALFIKHPGDTIDIYQARDAYYRAITPGKFKNLEPEAVYTDSTDLFHLRLKATPQQNFQLGVGGYLSTSTNSMLFLSGGYKTLSFNSLDVRLNGWLGQSYLAAEANARIRLLKSHPSSLQLRMVASRQKMFNNDRMFYQTSEPTAVITNEYFGRLLYGVAAGRRGKADISIGYGTVDTRMRMMAFTSSDEKMYMRQNMAEARAHYEYNTLNDRWIPTAGARYNTTFTGAIGQAYFGENNTDTREHRSWVQAEINATNYWSTSSKFFIGTEVNVLLSTRKLLPSYRATILDAPQFVAAPSYSNIFAPDFRGFNYATIGIRPGLKLSSMFQLRGYADLFIGIRPIKEGTDDVARYGKWFSKATFFGQMEGVVTLPFANISAYVHYAGVKHDSWNFGLTMGFFLQAPRFLR
ncbi:MAG: patatin-like phospholipase family protein [Bacteroides sp.]|nr:patatin-like phospholipase family protein [Bacteroides sp.]MCM1414245.1 patatin-like phospholipase family protein [Bacteroides sp.]MCM1471256.1 patatin-like phospholipase family protein [Bacteroides sp.]